MTTKIETHDQHLEPRPGSNFRCLFLKGRRIRAVVVDEFLIYERSVVVPNSPHNHLSTDNGARKLVERDFQFTSDPGSDREARFALVLLQIREVSLGHMGTGRQVGLS